MASMIDDSNASQLMKKIRVSLCRNSGSSRGKVLAVVVVQPTFVDVVNTACNKLRMSRSKIQEFRLFVSNKGGTVEIIRGEDCSHVLTDGVVVAVSCGEDFIGIGGFSEIVQVSNKVTQNSGEGAEEDDEEEEDTTSHQLALHSQSLHVCSRTGYIKLVGKRLEDIMNDPSFVEAIEKVPDAHKAYRAIRDGSEEHHMTLMHRTELSSLLSRSKHTLKSIHSVFSDTISGDDSTDSTDSSSDSSGNAVNMNVPLALGVGHAVNSPSDSFFIVCTWPSGQVARESLGLSSRHFHITLGFGPTDDVHDIPKDISTIVCPQSPHILLPYAYRYLQRGLDTSIKWGYRKHFVAACIDVCNVALRSLKEIEQSMNNSSEENVETEFKSCLSTANDILSQNEPKCDIDHIYLDLDGVLADFDGGVRKLTGKSPDNLTSNNMWSMISCCGWKKGFFGSLDWAEGGEALWLVLMPWGARRQLSVLTGLPRGGHTWAAGQKKKWCGQKMRSESGGDYKEVICCMSTEKYLYAKPEALLIDDRIQNCNEWSEAGGIFIHHTSFESTYQQLLEMGVVVSNSAKEEEEETALSYLNRAHEAQKERTATGNGSDLGESMNRKEKGGHGYNGKGYQGGGQAKKGKFSNLYNRNHGGKGQTQKTEVHMGGGGGRYFSAPTPTPRTNRDGPLVCAFFDSPRGCRHGSACKYKHSK